MSDSPKKNVWFPAKTYGYGWGFPRVWQGWAVLLIYAAAALLGGLFLAPKTRTDPTKLGIFVVYMLGLSALLCLVCWLKGEKPEWRWGRK